MNIGIKIKNGSVYHGLISKQNDPKLIEIELYLVSEYGGVMTESYRPQRHKNDLHGVIPVRAHDWRSWCYKPGVFEKMIEDINSKWVYDPKRPGKKVAYAHGTGRSLHLHLQVHPRTGRRYK